MAQRPPQSAVLGVDFGESGDDAIVAALSWLNGDPQNVVHAIHVLDPDDVKEGPYKPAMVTEAEALERLPAVLRNWIGYVASQVGLTFDPARVQTHVRIGKALETVLQVAVDYDADLIIVGTHGRRGLNRMLLGSVAEKLVRMAHCPVLVARPKDYTGTTKTKLPDPPYAPGEAPSYAEPRDVPESIRTESDIWSPSGGRPTGFRIV